MKHETCLIDTKHYQSNHHSLTIGQSSITILHHQSPFSMFGHCEASVNHYQKAANEQNCDVDLAELGKDMRIVNRAASDKSNINHPLLTISRHS